MPPTAGVGRIGDLLASQNGSSIFTCLNVSGNAVFLSGQQVQPFQLDASQGAVGFAARWRGADVVRVRRCNSTALRTVLTRNRTHLFENETVKVNTRSIDANTALAAALIGAPALTPCRQLAGDTTGDGRQSHQRQKRARGRAASFLVSMGGYDTHSAQDTASEPVATRVGDFVFPDDDGHNGNSERRDAVYRL